MTDQAKSNSPSEDRLDDTKRSPVVSVVIPTYNRPKFLREALDSVINQDYDGDIETLVVFDGTAPDLSLESQCPGRTVRVLSNSRKPGLAGNRNSGILKARGDFIAFCDDDDSWLPNKLSEQVSALNGSPNHDFVTTAMSVDFGNRRTDRYAGRSTVSNATLARSRMAMLHSSSFMARRDSLLNDIGLVDETLPQSMAEDRELLLRASRIRPILHVDKPLINVRWGEASYFAQQWKVRNEAELWMVKHYPEIIDSRAGAGLTFGKLAFGYAVQRDGRNTLHWAKKAITANWREPRTYIALAVSIGISWRWITARLSDHGRGI